MCFLFIWFFPALDWDGPEDFARSVFWRKADEKEMAAILLRARADVNQVAGRSRSRQLHSCDSEEVVGVPLEGLRVN